MGLSPVVEPHESGFFDHVARWLEDGDYGFCMSCGEPISLKRLSALPWARECVECAASHETGTRTSATNQTEEIVAEEADDDEILGNRSAEVDPLSSIDNEENEPMMPPDRLRRDSKM